MFNKIQRFVRGRILEAAVSGSILATMCKVCATVMPEKALDFFVPHLCGRIHEALDEVFVNGNGTEVQAIEDRV